MARKGLKGVMTLGLCKTGPRVQIEGMVNWESLMDKIKSPDLREQHLTTTTKLYIAKRHRDRLSEITPTQKITDLVKITVDEQNIITLKFPPSPVFLHKGGDYLGELDGFFYSLRSCIDSFLWEIDLIFNLESSRVKEIKPRMNEKYKDKEITKLLNGLQGEYWFKYLSYIRNNLSHRKLSEIATFTEDLNLYLPSNPKAVLQENRYSREKEFEVRPCLERLLGKTKEFLEKGCGLLIDEFG